MRSLLGIYLSNEDLLSIILALADEEDHANNEANEDEGGEDTTDDCSCRRARSDFSFLF